jgi:thiol-disulfide isomerase/thioredoxin
MHHWAQTPALLPYTADHRRERFMALSAGALGARRVDSRPSVEKLGLVEKPGLVFFYSSTSGRCRRVEGFLAQVLQRRRNHATFKLYRVDSEERPDLFSRFGVERTPTLLVLERKTVRGRLELPRGCKQIEEFLAPWLG